MSAPTPAQVLFWKSFPVLLLGSLLTGLGYMTVLATNDPGFSVEKDYYRKAVSWDAHQAQAQENDALGWHLKAELESRPKGSLVDVELVDRLGVALRGAIVDLEAFPISRGNELLTARLSESRPGRYQALVALVRPGIWELRITVRAGDRVFTQVERVEREEGGAS